jgi:predicted Na+-dependent transporter
MNQHSLTTMSQNEYDDIVSSSNDYDIVKHTAIRLLQDVTSNITNAINKDVVDDDTIHKEEPWKRIVGLVVSNILLFVLIFGLSATVDSKSLRKQLTNKFALCCGVTMQYVFMPILGCISVCIFSKLGMTTSIAITLMVVTASPGGSYSNWWCSTFNADLALSIAMSTVSSLLSIVFLPFNLFFYSWIAFGIFKVNDSVDSSSIVKSLSFTALFQSLAVVLTALVLGLLAGYKYDTPSFHNFNHKVGSISGILLIIFSIVVVSGPKAQLGSLDWTFYVGIALPCLGGLVLSTMLSRIIKLSPPETISVAIECCYQNTGIATSVAITMFSDKTERAQAVAVPLFYGIISSASILIFCLISWKMGVRIHIYL